MRPERKVRSEVHKRKGKGKEFQTVGAAKEKERRPFADLIKGETRRDLSEERREEDLTGFKSSKR